MARLQLLTEAERELIYQAKHQGKSLQEIAEELNASFSCVRKWWRRARKEGLKGLQDRPRGRPKKGTLSQFDPRVAQVALTLKQRHPRWGADRILVEMRQMTELQGLVLPSRSRLAVFLKERCPGCVAPRKRRSSPPSAPPSATAVHQIWQLDHQENYRLSDSTVVTVCNVRDPFGGAIIASCAFAVQTAKHWRKLTWQEVQQVLRKGFTEWGTLPDIVMTDNELSLAGSPTDPFPSPLTLWLRGLGVVHRCIRPHHPTDQAHVERTHRTLGDWTLDEESLASLGHLQEALDRERRMYNECFPSRAGDCAGRPPLIAHPELLQPRRPYHPEWEWALFEIQRVYDYLATFTFERKVSASGQVSLGRQMYSVGRAWAGRHILARLDPHRREWVFYLKGEEGKTAQEIARRTLKKLDAETVTGLSTSEVISASPIQLTLPCFV